LNIKRLNSYKFSKQNWSKKITY